MGGSGGQAGNGPAAARVSPAEQRLEPPGASAQQDVEPPAEDSAQAAAGKPAGPGGAAATKRTRRRDRRRTPPTDRARERAEDRDGVRRMARRFWPQTEGLRRRLAVSLGLVVLAPVLSTASIWLFKIVIDRVVVPHDYRLFLPLAAAYLGIAVAQGIVRFSDQYLSTGVSERFVLALRARVFAHLHTLDVGFFETHPLGDLLSRLTGDIAAIEDLLITSAAQLLDYSLQLLLFTGALFFLDWRLAAAAVAAAPGFLVAARYFSTRIKRASLEKRRRTGALTAVAEESFANVALVRAYDHADAEARRFAEQTTAAYRAQMSATRLQAMFAPLTDLLQVVGVLAVIGLAIYELAHGRLTIGGLLTFVTYLTQMYSPLQGLGQLTNQVYAASAGAERVVELLDAEPSVTDPASPTRLARARGAIRLDGVGFSYPGSRRPALREVTLTAEPGQKIALVGASGAGKSTLAKLLLRFSDPDTGTITLDDIDLRKITRADLTANVAAVLQETLVFDGTIAENIRWGRPDATDAQVTAAAIAADAHSFVTTLPDGYATRVGQRGRTLSGGQRQRIAIARAMIRDAPVLLLDEPTTGLDAESAHRVLEPLRRLMQGRTTIIISHNLLTVTDADRILYLERGTIAAAGTHAELLATSPGYAQLYRHNQEVPGVDDGVDPIGAHRAPDPAVTDGRGPNGRTAHGPTPNGPGAHGPSGGSGVHDPSRGSGAHGPGANGPGRNGSGANGPGANGSDPNGADPNGAGVNGAGPNGSGPNGSGANRPVPNGLDQPTDAINPAAPPTTLEVAWVRYQYPGHSGDALAEVSFTVPDRGCVAVVGPDGSGKTTLLRLLRGQLEPTSGAIRYRGSDSWQLDPTRRHRIALVPRDDVLADATVARAIAHDRPGASISEVVAAAAAAGASAFIAELPERYATRLGAGGYQLSEGQRRRIMVARALLGQPDVLLIDEPTSGLESRERQEMLGELCQLAADHTLVVATQDPLVIALADRVVHLEPARTPSP